MYTTRFATLEEIPKLVECWTKMTIEMSEPDGTPLPTDERITEIYEIFEARIKDGSLIFRVAVDDNGEIAACAGGLIRYDYMWPLSKDPSPVGWVVSVYTDHNHRKQGLANKIVNEVCEWLQQKEVSMIRLWASKQGKPTYEKLGFEQSSFMEKFI